MLIEPRTVRIFFSKKDRAIYISHLDLARTMGRALARSGIPIWYTQGFHPHIYMTFALPLSLGVSGLKESMDIRITDEIAYHEIEKRLDAALPEGLKALSVAEPVMQPKMIYWSAYQIELACVSEQGMTAVDAYQRQEVIVTQKRSKKGTKEVDIKPLFQILGSGASPSGISLTLRCRSGVETNLNPALVIESLCEDTGLSIFKKSITRSALLTEEGIEFA